MYTKIKFKIKKNKKGFVLCILGLKKIYNLNFFHLSLNLKKKIFNFYYIILFLIKFGLINVYI